MFAASYQIRPEQEEDNLRFQAVIRALEKHGVELDLFAAIVCNDVKRVAAIMRTEPKAGATKDPRGRPALHRAVTLDRQEIVKRFLEGGCNPDVPSEDENGYKGETALLNAAFWGRVEITKLLIQHRADVNAAAERGIVPLHEAVRMGNLEVARMLIAHGAKVNAKDNEGKTPLDWVDSFSKSAEMTKLLRDHGAVKKP